MNTESLEKLIILIGADESEIYKLRDYSHLLRWLQEKDFQLTEETNSPLIQVYEPKYSHPTNVFTFIYIGLGSPGYTITKIAKYIRA